MGGDRFSEREAVPTSGTMDMSRSSYLTNLLPIGMPTIETTLSVGSNLGYLVHSVWNDSESGLSTRL